MTHDILGRLTDHALKHDLIEYAAGVSMLLGGLVIAVLLTYYKKWRTLWDEWLTSVDHKKIGVMYIVVSFVMLVKGLIDAGMMRGQQAFAFNESMGYLGAPHFQEIFTAHGVTMIFFVGMGVMFGLINMIMPLQIGARDVAFPFLNSVSFWLFTSGAMFILVSLMIGVYAGTGWSAYPPLAGLKYNPGVGVDYWLWSVQISGIGSMLAGINFLVTILKMRAPGMTLMKMPVFVWASLATVLLVVFAFPILTMTVSMLSYDRLLGTHIFTVDGGGNPMMYINLFWSWGHPEVYILVLPAFGIFSAIVPVFSKKPLFGYVTMVWAIAAITFLSFIVWLHHFFTMGAGPTVNAFFGMMTMIIAVPTGVKIFNWLFTMFRGRVNFATPMYWFLGFVFIFTLGGMAGVLMSVPAADFQIHNSLFLVAHFHTVIIGGVIFGFFAGYTYWFPKFFGFKLDEKLGKYAFWFWITGFLIAFLPLYLLGFMGVTRRLNHFSDSAWQPLFLVAGLGAVLIFIGFFFQVYQMLYSFKVRSENKASRDPWDGRTLEWSVPTPVPTYNFAKIPEIHERDAFWAMKQSGKKEGQDKDFHDITLPKNTGLGVWIGAFSFLFGFGVVWYMWWLVVASGLGMLACVIIRLYQKETEYILSAEEVKQIERRNQTA